MSSSLINRFLLYYILAPLFFPSRGKIICNEYFSLLEKVPSTELICPFTGKVIAKPLKIYTENGRFITLQVICFCNFIVFWFLVLFALFVLWFYLFYFSNMIRIFYGNKHC